MHSALTLVNSRSWSLRFAIFKAGESLPQVLIGKFERIGMKVIA